MKNDESPVDDIEQDTTEIQEQGSNNTLTIILAVLLIAALAAIAFLLFAYVFNEDTGSGSEGEVVPPTEAAPPPAEAPADLPLQGPDWILAGTMEGTTISLIFSGDSLFGFAGCNSFNATYRSTRAAGPSNNISIGAISSTMAMCDEPIMNQEQTFLANLESASQYNISGSTLTLTTGGGPLTFGAAQATLLPD